MDADIEANTIDDDASQEDVLEHVASDDAPEVETTVTVVDENNPETLDDTESAIRLSRLNRTNQSKRLNRLIPPIPSIPPGRLSRLKIWMKR